MVIREAILKLSKKQNLEYDECVSVMDEIMQGKASSVQIGAYLVALALKGETIDEITASAYGMRKHCVRLLHQESAVEIVGTGGDGANTFNISTAAALIAATCGVPVAKHGNRSSSGRCGAADVLEALGVDIGIPPQKSTRILKDIGICFLFAQNYHIAMKHVAPVRKELGIRTVFNVLGPLVNPAGADMELMGVYDRELVEPLAQVLCNLDVKRGMVVHGYDGLDEISVCAPTYVCEVKDGWVKSYDISPVDFGLDMHTLKDLEGGDAKENAAIIRGILAGQKGAKRDAAVLNAAAAIYIAGRCQSVREGVGIAGAAIDSGEVARKLEQFIEKSNG